MAYLVFILVALFASALGHSQMRCAKYDMASGKCNAAIRNEGPSFLQEGYEISGGLPICQTPMSNPISAYYNNGKACPDYAPCPDPMGTYYQGENFTIMWYARNHAVENQTPGSVILYISPVETENQGSDYPSASYTRFCEAPYMSCNGQNGNFVQCYATCQMPVNAAVGIHTLWWKWPWTSATYSTCADITVTAPPSSSIPSIPPTNNNNNNPSQPASTSTSAAAQMPSSTSSSSSSSSSGSSMPVPAGQCASQYSQCGGIGFSGPTSCCGSNTCQVLNPYYSQCLAAPVVPLISTSTSTTGMKPSTTGMKPSTTGMKPSTTAAPSVPSSCAPAVAGSCSIYGNMVCVGKSSYQTCSRGTNGNSWSVVQNCPDTRSCVPGGDFIYCI